MSEIHLNDLSKIYIDQISEKKKDDSYLETDMKKRQANNEKARKEMEKIPGQKNPHFEETEIGEAVRGQDSEMRRAASAERRAGDKRLSPSKGKVNADNMGRSIKFYDKITKKTKPSVLGMTHEALDPVGQEDADIDNDGDTDKSDKYLHKRRKAIAKAMKKRKVSEQEERIGSNLKSLSKKATKRIDADVDGDVDTDDPKSTEMGEFLPSPNGKKKIKPIVQKEGFSNWRQELSEVMSDDIESKPIKEKKVNNKIVINPKLNEAVEEIGGQVIFISEVEEIDFIAESVHTELIEEGYAEEKVVEAIKYAIDEVTSPAKVASLRMKRTKYAPKPETKEEPKKSLKDRIKSVAKKALDKASETVGKVMKKKAEIQATPTKAKKKIGSYIDRAKAVAKAGYERGRGPVEKKSTAYRGAGVGRKEKIGEEASMSPQEIRLQKQRARIDQMIATKRKQELSKKKEEPAKAMGEEMSIKDQMRISREAAAKRKPYQPGDREKQRAAQMRNAAKNAKKDTRTDAEKMADAYASPRKGPGGAVRAD